MPKIETNDNLLEELRGRLKINKHALDEEVIQQPEIWFRAAEIHVTAISIRDDLKTQLKELHARLDADLRKRADRDGDKITENQIVNKITSSPEMKQLQGAYLNSCKITDLWLAMREAFSMKNDQLRNYIKVIGDSNYISDSIGKEVSEATDRKANRIRSETGKLRRAKRGRDDD